MVSACDPTQKASLGVKVRPVGHAHPRRVRNPLCRHLEHGIQAVFPVTQDQFSHGPEVNWAWDGGGDVSEVISQG